MVGTVDTTNVIPPSPSGRLGTLVVPTLTLASGTTMFLGPSIALIGAGKLGLAALLAANAQNGACQINEYGSPCRGTKVAQIQIHSKKLI